MTPQSIDFSTLIPEEAGTFSKEPVVRVPVEEICLNPLQPRKKIEEKKIIELSESIKEHGLLQPIIITRKDGLYHLVVGERRLRAVKRLGFEKIPAIIKGCAWDEMLKIALVENLQREDLGAVEEARAYRMLIDDYKLTQEQVSRAISRSRPYVANMVRLLNLPVQIIEDLESGQMTAGHARVLLGLDNEKQILSAAAKIKKKGLSVRQAEELVRKIKEGSAAKTSGVELPPVYRRVQDSLRQKLSSKVTIKKGRGSRGKIEIPFSSKEDLGRLVSLLGGDEEWT